MTVEVKICGVDREETVEASVDAPGILRHCIALCRYSCSTDRAADGVAEEDRTEGKLLSGLRAGLCC